VNPRIAFANRKLADAITAAAAQPPSAVQACNGVIKQVDPGASVDGRAQATVTVLGSDTLAPYLDSYTPIVGHLVRVEFTQGSPLIIGRVVGLPAF
jgi:hypothetical protein